MFGCIGRLGCLAVLLVAGALAWLTRDRWMGHGPAVTAAESGAVVWEPLSDEAAARARTAVQTLSRPSGAVFVNLRPGEVASYIFTGISKQLPPSARDVRAAVIGD